jgi:hypothetical protein
MTAESDYFCFNPTLADHLVPALKLGRHITLELLAGKCWSARSQAAKALP